MPEAFRRHDPKRVALKLSLVLAVAALAAWAGVAPAALAAGRICMSADTLSFGQRAVGSSTSASVAVSNCGTDAFSFTDVSLNPATNPAWRVDAMCATGQTLARGESCTVDVRFEPTAPGQASGALWLHNTTSTPDQLLTFYGRYTAYANECEIVRQDPHWIEEGATFLARLPCRAAAVRATRRC